MYVCTSVSIDMFNISDRIGLHAQQHRMCTTKYCSKSRAQHQPKSHTFFTAKAGTARPMCSYILYSPKEGSLAPMYRLSSK